MRRLFLVLTVAALMAMMVAAGPAKADVNSGGSTGGIDHGLAVTQSNGNFSFDFGDDDDGIDFGDDFGDDFGIFGLFDDDGIDFDFDDDIGDFDSNGSSIHIG